MGIIIPHAIKRISLLFTLGERSRSISSIFKGRPFNSGSFNQKQIKSRLTPLALFVIIGT